MSAAGKTPTRGWKPGTSGNPGGRPSGETGKLRREMASHAPELVARCIELALAGDLGAMRLCLERILPPLKAVDPEFVLKLGATPTPSSIGRTIFAAAASGQATPGQASDLLAALAAAAELAQHDAIERRLVALETSPRRLK